MTPILSNKQSIENVKFSILIPSYNRPQYLNKTIESILGSNNLDFELIISDDNSPLFAEILDVVNSFSYKVSFKLFHQSRNLGPTANKNFLVNLAIGEYVILLGDDDLLDPDILNKLESEIKQDKNKHSIYGFGYNVIDEFDNLISTFKSYKQLYFSNTSHPKMNIFFEGNIIPFYFFHPFTICYKRSINISYKEEAHIGYDFLFLYESILNNESIKVLPHVGFSWRKAQTLGNYQNLSNSKKSDLLSRIGIYKYFFLNEKNIYKLKVRMSKNHICKFVGHTLLLDKKNIARNLDLIHSELDANNYSQLSSFFRNAKNLYFLIVVKRLLQCFQLQGVLSPLYFGSRLSNILRKKIVSISVKYHFK